MLELLATVDPMAALMGGLWLFAAGMFPVGFMLGSECSPCCGCSACAEGTLPETVTVTLSGYEDGEVQGPDLAPLTFSSDFGIGAEGKVTAPSATPGPIAAVSITNGGEGYAVLARAEPAVTADVSGGSGAVLSVTLTEGTDTAWQNDGRPVWSVSGIALADGGSGYGDYASVTFSSGSGGVVLATASAVVRTNRIEPTVDASVASSSGSGAVLSVSLSETTAWGGDSTWTVSAIAINDGGSGYQVYDEVQLFATDGVASDSAYAYVSSVDEDGAATGVTVAYGGEFYKSGGEIQSVELIDGGAYFKEDTSVPGEPATVTVGVNQMGVAGFGGADLSAVIDTNPFSPTFGQITGVTINDGGNGYVAWLYRNLKCCADYYNGLTLVLARSSPSSCVYSHAICGTTCGASVSVEYRGPSQYPLVTVSTNQEPEYTCAALLTGTSYITKCSEFSFTAENVSGVTATVSPGGTYDHAYMADNGTGRCFSCCRGDADPPNEIEVEVAEKRFVYDENAGVVISDWIAPLYIDEGDGLPVVVLAKGLQPVRDTNGWIPACSKTWGGSLPNGYKISVAITQCTDSLKADCDHCWKKCETRALVETIFECYGFRNPDRGISDSCVSCEQSPLCGPVQGQYFVTTNFRGDGMCNLPGGVRVTVL